MMNKREELNVEMMVQVNGGSVLRADTGRLVPGSGSELLASGLAEATTVAYIDFLDRNDSGYQSVLAAVA